MNEELPKIQENTKLKPRNEVTLPELMELAQPLLKQWTEAENEKHRRELEYDHELLKVIGKQNRLVTVGLFVIVGIVLIVAGVLFILGRDSTAMDLIKLIVAVGGAAFGGYGWALARRRKEDGDSA